MKLETAVIFDQVWKSYPTYNRVTEGIKGFLFHLPQALRDLNSRRTALKNISFEIYQGENFGFVGRNGAGKSTTLGLIAGVLTPDKGSIQVNCRVSPLLELGAGFHPELTGRENILLNGVLLGLTKEEVMAHEEKIIEFSELGYFIDQPVRTYSSGMYGKLGFSVVSMLHPEILLLDEVLAVGDIAFQYKCKKKIAEFSDNNDVTVILVSHATETVADICHRAAWIEDQTVKMVGPARDVVKEYENTHTPKAFVTGTIMPKVLFNTYPAAFDVAGGGEQQLLAYHKELPKLDVETELYNLWKPNLDKCNIVHFFSSMSGSMPFCSFIKHKGIPLFISPNLWLSEENTRLYPMQEIRDQLALADRIICSSDMEVNRFSRILGISKDKFLTVYCGVDDIFLEDVNPEIYWEQFGTEKFILNVGTIESRKNQLALIRAMARFPEYKLVLMGQIRDKAYAERCFKEGGEQVRYLGAVTHTSPVLRSAMAACDAFVGAGLMETPGIANLEAAAQGAPLAVTEVGSTREYFEDYAQYLIPASDATIATAIEKVLVQGRVEALKQHVREQFSWKKVLLPLVNAYRKGAANE